MADQAAIYRQRWIILSFTIASIVVGLIAASLVTRKFEATSVVQFQTVPQLLEAQKAVNPTVDDRDFGRQIQAAEATARGREIARRVAKDLQLYSKPEYFGALGVGGVSSPEELTEVLRNRLSTRTSMDSASLALSFRTENPALSAALANSYAENLIALNVERQYEASSSARKFLAQKVDEANQQLTASEQAANAYAQRAGIVQSYGSEENSMTSLDASSLEQMNSDLTVARTARIRAEERWKQASSTPLMSGAEVQSNGAIQGLLAQKAELTGELAKLERGFLPGYPAVARLKSQISQIDREVQMLAEQVRSSLRDQYLTAARQERSLNSVLVELRSQALTEQSRIAQLDKLNREAAANRSLYDALLSRFQQVGAAAGIPINNMVVAERAAPSDHPSVPNVPLYLLAALAAGLFVGVGVALIREFVHNPIRSPSDVLEKLALPLLGATPPADDRNSAYNDLAQTSSPLSESYSAIRSAIDYATGESPKSLFITSSRAGEGKSTTALAIALNYSQIGKHVLIIDGDLRRPNLHRFFGADNGLGLAELLAGDVSFREVVQQDPRLDFVVAGNASDSPAQLLTAERLQLLLEEALSHYDLLVIDGPPVMALADAPQFGCSTEATVFVVESGKVEQTQVEEALRRMRESRSNIIGAVLTKFDPKVSGYGYDYATNYTYGNSTSRDASKM